MNYVLFAKNGSSFQFKKNQNIKKKYWKNAEKYWKNQEFCQSIKVGTMIQCRIFMIFRWMSRSGSDG